MNEEILRIQKMVAEGKITPEESVELIESLGFAGENERPRPPMPPLPPSQTSAPTCDAELHAKAMKAITGGNFAFINGLVCGPIMIVLGSIGGLRVALNGGDPFRTGEVFTTLFGIFYVFSGIISKYVYGKLIRQLAGIKEE
jgi:hypothetical protein